jgi:small subunit ribosomal protein S16
MSTRIRLRRMGANKRPFYRVVVADQRSPRNGRFIENIGKYHPLQDPSLIEIDEERALHWLLVGAQPSNQVRNLMDRVGIWEKFVAERPSAAIALKPGRDDKPVKEKVSKKAATKAATGGEPAVAADPAEPAATAENAEPAAIAEPAKLPEPEPPATAETPETPEAPDASTEDAESGPVEG